MMLYRVSGARLQQAWSLSWGLAVTMCSTSPARTAAFGTALRSAVSHASLCSAWRTFTAFRVTDTPAIAQRQEPRVLGAPGYRPGERGLVPDPKASQHPDHEARDDDGPATRSPSSLDLIRASWACSAMSSSGAPPRRAVTSACLEQSRPCPC
jgi:hypothetical protein